MKHVVRKGRLEEVEDDEPHDFELESPARLYNQHTNSIPLPSAVQTPRLFYGGRFSNQRLSLVNPEAPLIQNVDPEDPEGRSFDEILGEAMGAIRARQAGRVTDVGPDSIRMLYDDGQTDEIGLYRDFPFNQKSSLTNRVLVKPGDRVDAKSLLASSNFTDDQGTATAGVNARVALVPYRGYSMDDAVPISQSFAKRLAANQFKVIKTDKAEGLNTGKDHYRSLFPTSLTKEQLERYDDDGLIRKGQIVQPGDPVLLATMPRTMSSAGANAGKLSKALMQSRRDAASLWDGDGPAEVVDVRRTRNGFKAMLKYSKPAKEGDKATLRSGAKATISAVIPDDRMPRTADGQPLDMLLNPLSLVSRANPATQHELRLGKVAAKLGRPLKIPPYLPRGQSWQDFVGNLEKEHGVESRERIFDPVAGRELHEPVTVGMGMVDRLHHTAQSKGSARGLGSYTIGEQPSKGPGEMAQAKLFSGLENLATMSAGAYAVMRDNATIRGTKSDEFWRAMRSGKSLPKARTPFVWDKFMAVLSGAGINARDLGQGKYRLAPFTDRDLDQHDPVEVRNGELIDVRNMKPVEGGLFDPRIVSGDKWGRIRLPRPAINPAQEESVRNLLGLTKDKMDAILSGREEVPEELWRKFVLARQSESR